MTSAENSTGSSETYSGLNLSSLNLEAFQSTAPSDFSVAATANVSGGGQQPTTKSIQHEQQGENGLSESVLLPSSEASMKDYYELQQNLLVLTIAFGVVIFPFVWWFYSLQIALDYVLGTCVGIVYLRMLGRSVSKIGLQNGRQKKDSNAGRLAVFAALMIVALRWEQLDVIPVFLGFLTYKAAIIGFVLWTSVKPQREVA